MVEKTGVFDLILSHCGEGVLLRGGRTEGFRRLFLELAMLYASSEYRLSGHVRLVG